jgi:hypothetical protein
LSILQLQFRTNTDQNRLDKKVTKKGGLRKAFFVGGNSSCQAHIRQHYGLYQQRCKEKNIPENHFAIPQHIWKQMQAEKNNPNGKTQAKLDGMVDKSQGTRVFVREGVLHAVCQFIACDDQVSIVVSLQTIILTYLGPSSG